MAWFRKEKKPLKAQNKRDLPADIFEQCPGCGEVLYRERLAKNLRVCNKCGHHLRISSEGYLSILLDAGSLEELDGNLRASDPLGFMDLKAYANRIVTAESDGSGEAVMTATGRLDGIDLRELDLASVLPQVALVGQEPAAAGNQALTTDGFR